MSLENRLREIIRRLDLILQDSYEEGEQIGEFFVATEDLQKLRDIANGTDWVEGRSVIKEKGV